MTAAVTADMTTRRTAGDRYKDKNKPMKGAEDIGYQAQIIC